MSMDMRLSMDGKLREAHMLRGTCAKGLQSTCTCKAFYAQVCTLEF